MKGWIATGVFLTHPDKPGRLYDVPDTDDPNQRLPPRKPGPAPADIPPMKHANINYGRQPEEDRTPKRALMLAVGLAIGFLLVLAIGALTGAAMVE